MTIQEFTRDVIPLIQSVLTLFGLASIALLWWQVRTTLRWNKVDAAFRCMNTEEFARVEREALEAALRLGVNLTDDVSEADVRKIRADKDALLAVKSLFIFLDKLAVAYQAGYLDEHVFTATWGRLIRGYRQRMNNYIKVTRADLGDAEVYVELERAAEKLESEYQNRQRSKTGDGVGQRI